MSVSPPTIIFLLSILLGFFWGIFWDINRVLKKLVKSEKNRFVFVLDISFSVAACILTIIFFYCFTYAGFRFFVLVGAFLGFILYYCTIQRPIFYILHIVIGFIIKIIFKILNIAKIIGDKLKIILETICRFLIIKMEKMKKIKMNKKDKENQMEEYVINKVKKFMKKNKILK